MSVEACTRFVFRCPFLYFSYILTTLHCAEHCLVRWIDDVSAFWPAAEARSETTRRPPVRGERDLKWERAEGWHKSNVLVPVLITSRQSSGVEVEVISHKRQRYAVWFGGSLLASLVSEYWATVNMVADSGDSLNFTPLATPRHSMTRSGRALDGATRSSAARLSWIQFCTLKLLVDSGRFRLLGDGQILRILYSWCRAEKPCLHNTIRIRSYWMSIIQARMK